MILSAHPHATRADVYPALFPSFSPRRGSCLQMARLSEETREMALHRRSQRLVERGEEGVEGTQWPVGRTGRGRGRRERQREKETKKTRMGHASWPENKYALFFYSLHSVNVILSCKLWTLTTILFFFSTENGEVSYTTDEVGIFALLYLHRSSQL